MIKRILIIGSSSNVAQAISEDLINNEYEMTGTYNNNYPKNPECYKSLVKVDFLKKNEIHRLGKLSNISDIIFTIGQAEFLDRSAARENHECLKDLINYLNRINKNLRIIFCSSSSVYGNNKSKVIDEKSKKDPVNYYGKYKLMSENLIKKSKIDYVIVRFPIIFGRYFKEKFSGFIDKIRNNHATIFGNGNNYFSFIHQDDISKFILNVIDKRNVKNEDFNLSSGSIKQREYISLVAEIFGKKEIRTISLEKALGLANQQLKTYKKDNIKPTILRENIIGLSRDRKYNCNKAKQIIGWQPEHKLNSIIKDTFTGTRILPRRTGIRILRYLFGEKLLPVKIYRDSHSFNPGHFEKKEGEIWSVSIRNEEGDISSADHLFSREVENIKNFMIRNEGPNKVYTVGLTPSKEDIFYYGSFLIDKINFKERVIITISRKPKEPFTKRKQGQSFKILPRDFNPDYSLEFKDGNIKGDFPKKYKDSISKDIEQLIKFLIKTKRENLITPVLFIISNKGVRYVSLGL